MKNNKKKVHKRNIIYYNPPYNIGFSTNIGKKFLQLTKDLFPKNHQLPKLCNKNTVKLSYSVTKNMMATMQSHNQKKISQVEQRPKISATYPILRTFKNHLRTQKGS